jgi:hypothetical protein
MDDLARRGIVDRETLTFVEQRDASNELRKIQIRGRVQCPDGVVIIVDKWLDVRRGPQRRYEVKGERYSYHAWRRSSPRLHLFRYDSAHGLDRLHRHEFDLLTGIEVAEPEQVRIENLPTLDLVILEAVALGQRASRG